MEEQAMATCPACTGRKGSVALVMLAGKGCEERWMACFLCKGEGVVTPEKLSWVQRGHAMTEARQARDMSLFEEAKRLGISRVELSQMEHGQIEPFDYDELRAFLEG